MRKIVIIFVLLVLGTLCFSITLADLDFEDQLAVKDYVISLDEEITEINVEQLEGIKYNIIFENDDYIIVEKNGVYVLVPKS
jgi:23S rRNA-/tRNA-specific pseudouridylate synthase